jgi:hypothetical protein
MSAFANCRSPTGAGSPLEGVAGPGEPRRAQGEEGAPEGKSENRWEVNRRGFFHPDHWGYKP